MIQRRFAPIVLLLIVFIFSFPQKSSEVCQINTNNDFDAINHSLSGIDLDVTYISREPRYNWDSIKKWPDPGEQVTFTAHIVNKGTVSSGAYSFQWSIDNQVVSTGSANSIPPQGEATQILFWEWQPGRHFVSFEVDPQNFISETAETNNIIEDVTDAMTIGFWVEETVYHDFNNIQNGAGTYSWEDWAQRIIQKMNWMFERSVYPLAPNGALTRVRLDNVAIAQDGTLFSQGPWHAPYDTIYDGRWGFPIEEYGNGCQCCPADLCYDYPSWVNHELMHYLFARIDLYAFDVQGGDVKVRDENGNLIAGTPHLPYVRWDVLRYANRSWDLMHHPSPHSLFSDYIVYSLNIDWPMGQRTHRSDWEHYILELPSETKIRVLDNNEKPIPGIQVSVYQAVWGDGSSGPYSQDFDNLPDIVGTTDSNGLFSLGGEPFGNLNQYGTPAGVVLIKLRHPSTNQSGFVWLELTDLNMAFWRGETNLYVHDIHFPDGLKRLKLSKNDLSFLAFRGTNPTPQNVEISLLGEGVAEWSVSKPNSSWLRTIPYPDLETQSYSFGPLTFIVNSTNLPNGNYTAQVSIDAGSDVLDSPQTIDVKLTVVDPPPPSSISGKVVDSINNPIAGVVVSDEFGHTSTTNAVGSYSFSGLPAGTYTLTPSKTGFTFVPASKMVTVPPNATNINFVAEGGSTLFSIYLPLLGRNFSKSQSFIDMIEDGEVLNLDCPQNWSACRNASSGNAIWQNNLAGTVGATYNVNGYTIQRVFLYFDTSSIPTDAQILNANLRVYAGQYQNGNNKIHVVQSLAGLPLQASDFGKVSFTSGGTVTPTPNTWTDIPLSSTALNWIAKGGITSLALIHDLDFKNVTPTLPNDSLVMLAESSYKATLVVNYSSNE